MIEGLPHLVLVPVGRYLPKPPDLRFPHSGVINTKGIRCVLLPLISVSVSVAVVKVVLVDPIFVNTHHYVPP